MLAATAIFNKPTTIITYFSELKLRKPISRSGFPTSKLVFSGIFVSRKSVSWKNRGWSPNTMADLIKTRVSRGSNSDESVTALEQQAFIDGPSEFRPNLTSDGLESTLNRLSKWLVTAFFGTILLWRHDAEALWAAMGCVLNSGLSHILKQMLNQERPVSTLRSDPGMPSSHAQSFFFAVIFAVLSMIELLGVNGLTITLSGLVFALGSYLSWLRVSQQLHTISQVIVGALVGSIFSILWFWLWEAIVLKAFISYLWVRIFVVVGAAGFCLSFVLYVIQHWLKDE